MTTYALNDHESVTVTGSSGESLVVEAEYRPGTPPPPLHWHPVQSERFEVHEGTLQVTVNGAEHVYRTGDAFEIPPLTEHRMWNPGDVLTRASWRTAPALSTEQWFARLDALGAKGHPDTLDLAEAAWEFRDVFRPAIAPRILAGPTVAILAAVASLRRRILPR